MIKYSICTTTYNVAPRVKDSIESLLKFANLTENWEFIVVDSKSKDGTFEILKEYEKKFPNFKLISKKCNRGAGRQIAFENAAGEYILQVDLDTIYLPIWIVLLNEYEKIKDHHTFALQAPFFGIYPTLLLKNVGGWKKLQYGEDFDLWWRLLQIDAFKWTDIVVGENWEKDDPESRQSKNINEHLWRTFIREKDRFISRSEYYLRDRLENVRAWVKSSIKYYLMWVPLETLAFLFAIIEGREKRDKWNMYKIWSRNKLEFKNVEGKRINYNFAWENLDFNQEIE